MKRLLTIAIFLLAVSTHFVAVAQCGAGGITFSSQADINNFTTNYPGCTQILGGVTITGSDITNLNGLAGVISVAGTLSINNNPMLTNISALSSLTAVGTDLEIIQNPVLTSLTGLSALTSVSSLAILNNLTLANLTGLSGLTTVYHINLTNNPALTSLSALSGITSVGGFLSIDNNDALPNLTGLSGITSIGGNLYVGENAILTNLSGLSGLTSLGGFINILLNPALSKISGLSGITSVPSYLSIRGNDALTSLTGLFGITSVGGDIDIAYNAALTSIAGLSGITGALNGFLRIEAVPVTSLLGLSGITSIHGGFLVIRGTNITNLHELSGITGALGGYLDISYNGSLTNVTGLSGITSVGGALDISGNSALASLTGLANVTAISGYMRIRGNPITSLAGLNNIIPTTITDLYLEINGSLNACELPNICTYLSNSSHPASIFGNATNCATRTAVQTACAASTPPTITQCPANQTVNITTNNCTAAMPNMLGSFTATDNCPTPTTLTYTQSPVTGTTLSGHGTVQTVVFTVTDNCGKSSTCSATVTLKDIRSPALICLNTNVALNAGTVTITPNDVINSVSDNCTPSNAIQLSLSKSTFTCADVYVSPISVKVTAIDLAGNTDICIVYITVEDHDNSCPPPVTLAGKVKTESGVGIPNVDMELRYLGQTVRTTTTNVTGNYTFPNLSPNTNYTVGLSKNTNPLNGVTTADATAISNHITASPSLNSPYKIMAANVTETDSDVSVVDIADNVRLLQALHPTTPVPLAVASWVFVPANHVFSTTPPAYPTPQPIRPFGVNIAVSTANYDFIGVKKGDATGDADPNQ